jgi:hypothetical protein
MSIDYRTIREKCAHLFCSKPLAQLRSYIECVLDERSEVAMFMFTGVDGRSLFGRVTGWIQYLRYPLLPRVT